MIVSGAERSFLPLFLPVPFAMKPRMSFKLSLPQIRRSRNLRIHSERKIRRACCTARRLAR